MATLRIREGEQSLRVKWSNVSWLFSSCCCTSKHIRLPVTVSKGAHKSHSQRESSSNLMKVPHHYDSPPPRV